MVVAFVGRGQECFMHPPALGKSTVGVRVATIVARLNLRLPDGRVAPIGHFVHEVADEFALEHFNARRVLIYDETSGARAASKLDEHADRQAVALVRLCKAAARATCRALEAAGPTSASS